MLVRQGYKSPKSEIEKNEVVSDEGTQRKIEGKESTSVDQNPVFMFMRFYKSTVNRCE